MSTGLAVFDTTLQETNAWLRLIEERLPGCDRRQSYLALRAVLHVLRDRLPEHAVLGLSAQVPMLVRGILLEGWRPGDAPSGIRKADEFADAVAAYFPPNYPREPQAALRAVLEVISLRITQGEVSKIVGCLPEPLRVFWPETVTGHGPGPRG